MDLGSMVIYQNMPEFNSLLSVAVPQTLVSADRERIAGQIVTVLTLTDKELNLKKARCLDVGSSSGEVSSHLCGYVKEIVCLDVDKNALDIGRKKFARMKNLRFREFDGVNIPFADDCFDVIILRKVIEMVEHAEKLTEEVFRVLKPGGVVYFEGPNVVWPYHPCDTYSFVPVQVKKMLAIALRHKQYYFPTYRNYWQLKTLFKKFVVIELTPRILKNPAKYKFVKLKHIQPISNFVPSVIFKAVEPFNRHFIWVLKKP
jgi:ubiquinone/menaquinone biosynthesis C-methylase UbiE